jgi:hypothetical protein
MQNRHDIQYMIRVLAVTIAALMIIHVLRINAIPWSNKAIPALALFPIGVAISPLYVGLSRWLGK